MNRPEARKYEPSTDNYAFEHYVADLERYCDYLEDARYDLLDGNHRLYEKNKQLEKALEKACHVIDDLKDCTNIGSEIYRNCPFKEECNKGRFNGCIASKEKWKEWLLND